MVPHESRPSHRVPGITVDPGDPPGHSETALCGSAHSFQLFPPFLPGSSPALQAGASCLGPLAAICFLALLSAHGTGPGLLPGPVVVQQAWSSADLRPCLCPGKLVVPRGPWPGWSSSAACPAPTCGHGRERASAPGQGGGFCLPVIAPTHQREAQNFSF